MSKYYVNPKSTLLFFLLLSMLHISAQPTIGSFSPASGPIGTVVTITGTNFSTTAGNNIVFFGSVKAVVTAATTTSIILVVPAGTTYQPITVTTSNLTAYSAKPFVVTFTGGGAITESSFSSKIDSSTGFNPYNTCIGDIDGDGKSDIVTANGSYPYSLSISRNTSTNGNISFANKVEFTTGLVPFYVVTGDLNGDGKSDIVIANSASNNISVYKNSSTAGTISFSSITNYVTGTSPNSIIICDLDGDGKPDIAVTNYSAGTFSILKNTSIGGSISFAAKVDISTGANPSNIRCSDLDGDGKPDLVLGNQGGNTLSFYKNISIVGAISFASKTDLGAGTAASFALGDIDNDGKQDIASSLGVFKNTSTLGAISFASISLISGAGGNISLGDIDGDGKIDIVSSNEGSNSVSVLRNTSSTGTISFAIKAEYITGESPNNNVNGDLNGDGMPEIVTANSTANSISIFKNKVNGPNIVSFSPTSAQSGNSVTINGTNFTGITSVTFGGVAAASFNVVSSTMITAILSSSGASGSVNVSNTINTGVVGGFAFLAPPVITGFTPTSGTNGSTITITGSNFTSTTSVSFGGTAATSFTVLSPSTITAVVGASTSGNVQVNNPYGSSSLTGFTYNNLTPAITSFSPTSGIVGTIITITGTNFTGTSSVKFGGIPAASFTILSPTTITAILGNGTSGNISVTSLNGISNLSGFNYITHPSIVSFSPLSGIAGSIVTISGLNFSNINNNNLVYFGSVKAVVTAVTPNSLSVIVPVGATQKHISVTTNNLTAYSAKPFILTFTGGNTAFSSSSFEPRVNLPINGRGECIVSSDLDGDGKPDLIVAGGYDDSLHIIRNNSTVGTISFNQRLGFFLGADALVTGCAVGDLNGDGKPDVVALAYWSNKVYVYQNNSTTGNISFLPPVQFTTDPGPNNVVITDIDGDGRLDVAVACYIQSTISILRNNTLSNGEITFLNRVNLTGIQHPGWITFGDINGDNKFDLITSSFEGNTVSVFPNSSSEGTIAFSTRIDLTCGNYPYGVSVGDIDGDGRTDIAVTSTWDNGFSILMNQTTNGNIAFSSKVDYPTGVFPYDIAIADLNGDGQSDIALVNEYSHTITICKNNSTIGTLNISAAVNYNSGHAPYALSIVDIDGDGKMDIATSGVSGSSNLGVFRNAQTVIVPLNILSFNGQLSSNQTLLKWQTANETNTSIFIIEHSTDAISFSNIGKLSAAGESYNIRNYFFTHTTPKKGINYYRLKMVDANGKFTYSQVIQIRLNDNKNIMSIHPNPAGDYVIVEHPNTDIPAQISFRDISGKLILTNQVSKNASHTKIVIKGLLAGTYQIIWTDGVYMLTQILLKQ
ncbi:MAG: VCBS repeat-containing protein [Bacteroidia bacterium]|nr:VCBS repeat-containing protein [Bacteroidia bacterium]